MKTIMIFLMGCFVLITNLVAEEEKKLALDAKLEAHVLKLTGTPKPRNHINIKSLNLAKEYIQKQFKDLGLKASLQEYKVGGIGYANVIGKLDVKAKKTIIVGAHYDVCDEQVGADDNASGVAGLIELARLLVAKKTSLKHNIEFVAYTLEEPPYFRTKNMGSYIHAQSYSKKKDKIEYMVCLEMIGFFTSAKNSQEYPAPVMKKMYPSTGNFIAVVGNSNSAQIVASFKAKILANSKINCQGLVAPPQLPGVDFSDHLNYWAIGLKAVMITDTSFYRNKNYHKKTDLPKTLNYKKMAEVVKGLATTFYK
ncbi:MAG: peptidase M28 [Planctomycetota bacterium]|nr:MAG: peptidase M28 [Planctomycetota bacterium]